MSIRKKRYHKGGRKRQSNIPRFDRNTYIKAPQVRVIDSTGDNLGVLDRDTALEKARSQELDLVLVNPNADPPVARIISWSKFKYDQSKKQKANKNKSSELKEMWFKPFIDVGDLNHKIARVQEFVEDGNKVKVTVRSKRGATPDKIREVMDQIVEQIEQFAQLESGVKREGRNLSAIVIAK